MSTKAPAPTAATTPTAIPALEELVFTVTPWSDIITPFTTSLASDGRLVTIRLVGWDGVALPLEERHLSPLGVSMVRDAILATGLFDESAEYWPVPLPGHEPPARGASGYTVQVGTQNGTVSVSWSSVEDDEADWAQASPERTLLDDLGSRLIALDAWLSDDAWADKSARPYAPEQYRLFVISQPWGGSLDELPPEYTGVDWPFPGDLMSFGDPTSGSSDVYRVHCGVLELSEAQATLDALADVGAPFSAAVAERMVIATELGDTSAGRVIDLVLVALHPHEHDCIGAAPPGWGW